MGIDRGTVRKYLSMRESEFLDHIQQVKRMEKDTFQRVIFEHFIERFTFDCVRSMEGRFSSYYYTAMSRSAPTREGQAPLILFADLLESVPADGPTT